MNIKEVLFNWLQPEKKLLRDFYKRSDKRFEDFRAEMDMLFPKPNREKHKGHKKMRGKITAH